MAAEVVGTIASVATLSKLILTSVTILRRWIAVPQEISRVSEELTYLINEAQIIHKLERHLSITSSDIDRSIVDALNQQIKHAEINIKAFHDQLLKLTEKAQGHRGRLKWLVIGREESSSLLDKLQRTRTALNLTLHLHSCISMNSHHIQQMKAYVEQKQTLEQLSLSLNTRVTPASVLTNTKTPSHSNQPYAGYYVPHHGRSTISSAVYSESGSTTIACQKSFMGSNVLALASAMARQGKVDIGFSLLLSLPFAKALYIILLIRFRFGNIWNVRLSPGASINFVTLVDEHSPFIRACANDDIDLMRTMLKERRTSLNVITATGYTPMSMAIKNGSKRAVELLLDEGADVNGLFGRLQTSPLAEALRQRRLDIARLLVSREAACEHLTGYGWTPLFYLWSEIERGPHAEPSAEGLINMLANSSDFGLSHDGIIDTAGFGVIHMAACNGTATEVATLIRHGVNAHALNGPLKWTAIHNAVFEGKLETFETLIPHYRNYHIDTPDTRGWTLLHIAASAGHIDIVERLLQMGADWQARSWPSDSHMPESLFHGSWTPAQIAEAQSTQRRVDYLNAVKNVLGEDVLSIEELKEVNEVWHDVQESHTYT